MIIYQRERERGERGGGGEGEVRPLA